MAVTSGSFIFCSAITFTLEIHPFTGLVTVRVYFPGAAIGGVDIEEVKSGPVQLYVTPGVRDVPVNLTTGDLQLSIPEAEAVTPAGGTTFFSTAASAKDLHPFAGLVTVNKNIESFILNSDLLSPLGIITNELLTNIMKYAFIGKNNGTIVISIKLIDSRVSVIIEDNGNGLPENINFENSTGFGLMLIGILVKQIGGRISIERKNGTKIILEFNK